MANSTLCRHHLAHVSWHINQTHLVTELLKEELINYDNIHKIDEDTEAGNSGGDQLLSVVVWALKNNGEDPKFFAYTMEARLEY